MTNSTIPQSQLREDEAIGLGEQPDIPVEMRPPSARHRWYLPVKVCLEWVIGLLIFVASSPALVMLALLVKITSSGPAFYAQTRLGRGGKVFRIYKLRTMRHNAEQQSGPVWAAKDDVRVTALGKLLRDTHLDELPQLWNVLRGEMGLIGPRPERPEIAARISTKIPGFGRRLSMRPGVTGLAQMLVPADDPDDADYQCVRRKLAHDLIYLREVSALLDVQISLSTSCYFCAAAVDAVRRLLLRSYGKMAESQADAILLDELSPTELKQGAA